MSEHTSPKGSTPSLPSTDAGSDSEELGSQDPGPLEPSERLVLDGWDGYGGWGSVKVSADVLRALRERADQP